jgi:hypothetical protein
MGLRSSTLAAIHARNSGLNIITSDLPRRMPQQLHL